MRRNPDEELRELERAASTGDLEARRRLVVQQIRAGTFDGVVKENPFFFVRVTDRRGRVVWESTTLRSDYPGHGAPVEPWIWSVVNRVAALGPHQKREDGSYGPSLVEVPGNRITLWASLSLHDGRHVVRKGQPHSHDFVARGARRSDFSDFWRAGRPKHPILKNPDEEFRELARELEAHEGDDQTLIERAVVKARRADAWWLVNAAMSHANYPTWNKIAPSTYAGAASWPDADRLVGVKRAHEMLSRVATEGDGFSRVKFREHLYPLLEVLIGGRQPARYVDEPGVHAVRHRVGDTGPDVGVDRAWIASGPPYGDRFRRQDFLTGVLVREDASITLADGSSDMGGWNLPDGVMHWFRETQPHLGGSWLAWSRNAGAFDRVRLPLDLAHEWLKAARRFWPSFSRGLTNLFRAEISNEAHGGVSPATLASALDSLESGFDPMLGDDQPAVEAELRRLIAERGEDTEIRNIFVA